MEHNDWILDKIRAAVEVVSGRILIRKWEDTFSTASSQQYRLLISANIRTMCPCRCEKCQTSFICRSVCLFSRIGTESPKMVSFYFFLKNKSPFSLPLKHWLIWSCDRRYFLVTGCHVMPLKWAPCSRKSLLKSKETSALWPACLFMSPSLFLLTVFLWIRGWFLPCEVSSKGWLMGFKLVSGSRTQ